MGVALVNRRRLQTVALKKTTLSGLAKWKKTAPTPAKLVIMAARVRITTGPDSRQSPWRYRHESAISEATLAGMLTAKQYSDSLRAPLSCETWRSWSTAA